jgi:hypothetical protein
MLHIGRRVPGPADDGETLIEVLAALILLSGVVFFLVQGVATVVALGTTRQQQANLTSAARTITEALNAFKTTSCSNTAALTTAVAVSASLTTMVKVSAGPTFKTGMLTSVNTTLNGAVTSGQTSITVTSTTGLPAAPFALSLDPGAANFEVVNVTAVSGTTLTVTRAQDGTTAVAHSSGATAAYGALTFTACSGTTDTGIMQVLFTLSANTVGADGNQATGTVVRQVAVLLGSPRG